MERLRRPQGEAPRTCANRANEQDGAIESKDSAIESPASFCFGCGFAHATDYADCVWNKDIG
jgi:hypothetical protein